jgi:hypothetical protein
MMWGETGVELESSMRANMNVARRNIAAKLISIDALIKNINEIIEKMEEQKEAEKKRPSTMEVADEAPTPTYL